MLRFLTAGESHGPSLLGILEGMPAGLPIDRELLDGDLRRRQGGYGRSGRQKIERDTASLFGGIENDHSTGGPIALQIENRDWARAERRSKPVLTVPRPGHADLAGARKYGLDDLRTVLERASARETAMRVAVGAICKMLLLQIDVRVVSHVTAIGTVAAPAANDLDTPEMLQRIEQSPVRMADHAATERSVAAIDAAREERDTLGGVFEVHALHVPVGLGSYVHYDRRLDGRLAQAVMSIQAVKGVEIGPAFENAALSGTKAHDGFSTGKAGFHRTSNRAGGLEGGVTNGETVVVRAAMKPISTTLDPIPSVDLGTGQAAFAQYQRSDICAVPAASVVAEAMVAFVIADACLEKFGGDSVAELVRRFRAETT